MEGINPHDPDGSIDQMIKKKARRLARTLNTPEADADDFAQDIWLKVLVKLDRFDPDRGDRLALAQTIVDNECVSIARYHRCLCRDGRRTTSLSASAEAQQKPDPRDQRIAEVVDMAIDLEERLAPLPPAERELLDRLRTGSVSEVKAQTGVHRSTIYHRLKSVRGRVGPLGVYAVRSSDTSGDASVVIDRRPSP